MEHVHVEKLSWSINSDICRRQGSYTPQGQAPGAGTGGALGAGAGAGRDGPGKWEGDERGAN